MTVASRNILIIKHGAFGDVLLCDGALRDIRAHHAHDHLTVLTTPPFKRVFERCPWVDEVMIDPRIPRWRLDAMAALSRRVRACNFDMVYDLQDSRRTAFYKKWLFGDMPWSPRFRRGLPGSTVLTDHAGLLTKVGVPVRHTLAPDVRWMADKATDILEAHHIKPPYVVLLPGSSARHPEKRWPHYGELATALTDAGYCTVTAPGPDEQTLCRNLPATMLMGADGRVLDFFQLAGVLHQACYVVGNDTGPSHLAAHMGIPGLLLFDFRYTSAARTGILRPGIDVIEVEDLKALPPEQVMETTLDRLKAIVTVQL